MLTVGVQGCGKSLAAKAIARRWRPRLLKLDAGRLYDKYIGESEKNLRRAFELAESMAPAVLWIDELEKTFSTGETSTRVSSASGAGAPAAAGPVAPRAGACGGASFAWNGR